MIFYEALNTDPYEVHAMNIVSKERDEGLVVTNSRIGLYIGKQHPYSIVDEAALKKHNAVAVRTIFEMYGPSTMLVGNVTVTIPQQFEIPVCVDLMKRVEKQLKVETTGELFGGIALTINNKVCLICGPFDGITNITIRLIGDEVIHNELSAGFVCNDYGYTGLNEVGYHISIRQAIDATFKALAEIGVTKEFGNVDDLRVISQEYMDMIASERWIKEGVYP